VYWCLMERKKVVVKVERLDCVLEGGKAQILSRMKKKKFFSRSGKYSMTLIVLRDATEEKMMKEVCVVNSLLSIVCCQ